MPLRLNTSANLADKEAFDAAMRRAVGSGRLELANLPNPDQENYLSMLLRMGQTGASELAGYQLGQEKLGKATPEAEVDLGIVDDMRMNACVVGRGVDSCWIGITTGLSLTLSTIYNNIFRHRDLFRSIGDASVERHDGPILIDERGGYSSASHDSEEINWEPSFEGDASSAPPDRPTVRIRSMGQPIDPVRRAAYYVCLAVAWDAIVCHEIGHIVKGHLSLFEEDAQVQPLFEAPALNRAAALPTPVVQALEIDADCHAASVVWTRWGHSGDLLSYQASESAIKDPSLQLRLWFIATNALYWAFAGTSQTRISRYDGMTHPHPDVRLTVNGLFLNNFWRRLLSSDKQRIVDETWPMIVEDIVSLRDVLHVLRDQNEDVERRRFLDPTYRGEIQERLTRLSEGQAELERMHRGAGGYPWWA